MAKTVQASALTCVVIGCKRSGKHLKDVETTHPQIGPTDSVLRKRKWARITSDLWRKTRMSLTQYELPVLRSRLSQLLYSDHFKYVKIATKKEC